MKEGSDLCRAFAAWLVRMSGGDGWMWTYLDGVVIVHVDVEVDVK